jgi:DNA-binding transcriptional ArsR family regulator
LRQRVGYTKLFRHSVEFRSPDGVALGKGPAIPELASQLTQRALGMHRSPLTEHLLVRSLRRLVQRHLKFEFRHTRLKVGDGLVLVGDDDVGLDDFAIRTVNFVRLVNSLVPQAVHLTHGDASQIVHRSVSCWPDVVWT